MRVILGKFVDEIPSWHIDVILGAHYQSVLSVFPGHYNSVSMVFHHGHQHPRIP